VFYYHEAKPVLSKRVRREVNEAQAKRLAAIANRRTLTQVELGDILATHGHYERKSLDLIAQFR
jgi:hypothetical protein